MPSLLRTGVEGSPALTPEPQLITAQLQNADINWQLVLVFIPGGLVGARVCGRLAGRIDEVKLSWGFAVLVTMVGVYLVA